MPGSFLLITSLLAAFLMCISCGQPVTTNNAASNSAATSPTPNAAAIEAEIKKAMDEMAAALTRNDASAMEKMLTDTYRFVSTDGSVFTGPERVALMKSASKEFESVTYDEISVRSNQEGNGAVSIARVTIKASDNTNPVNGQSRVTYVWSKAADGWRLASAQVTEIKAATTGAKQMANTASNSNAPASNK